MTSRYMGMTQIELEAEEAALQCALEAVRGRKLVIIESP